MSSCEKLEYGVSAKRVTRVLFSYSAIFGAGNCRTSQEITILSHPVPNSSHILNRLINSASFSFLDFGELSIILCTSTSGIPAFVISIRLSKISTTGPVPLIEKS